MIKVILQNERGSYVFQEGAWTDEFLNKEVSDSELVTALNSEVADELPKETEPASKVYIRHITDKGDWL